MKAQHQSKQTPDETNVPHRQWGLRPNVVIELITAGIVSATTSIISQSIINLEGGSILVIAVGAAIGAYIGIMVELVSQWVAKIATANRQKEKAI